LIPKFRKLTNAWRTMFEAMIRVIDTITGPRVFGKIWRKACACRRRRPPLPPDELLLAKAQEERPHETRDERPQRPNIRIAEPRRRTGGDEDEQDGRQKTSTIRMRTLSSQPPT
jgi:hypothetical protein